MKETKKQIKAQLINELTRKYDERYGKIEEDLKNLRVKHQKTSEENYDLRVENNKLKVKLEQYEDWINRLQEFCNMDEGERDKAIKKYVAERDMSDMMKRMLNGSSSIWNLLSLYKL